MSDPERAHLGCQSTSKPNMPAALVATAKSHDSSKVDVDSSLLAGNITGSKDCSGSTTKNTTTSVTNSTTKSNTISSSGSKESLPHYTLSSCNHCLRRAGLDVIDAALNRIFAFIGYHVAMRPYTTLVISVLVGLSLATGILRIHVVTTTEDLYTPQGTQGFKDRDYVDSMYGDRTIQVSIYTTVRKSSTASGSYTSSNVLNKEAILAQLDLWEKISSMECTTHNGTRFTLEDPGVCYKPGGPTTPCQVVSVLDFWNYSRAAIEADADISSTVSNVSAVDRIGRPIPLALVMGGVVRDDISGRINSVGAFQTVITLLNESLPGYSGSHGEEFQASLTVEWQRAATRLVRQHMDPRAEFFMNSPRASNDVINDAVTADVSLIVLGYVLLIVYGIIVLSRPHPVFSHGHMALANIASIGLAVVATYGLCIFAGVTFSLVVQVLALLLLGLGTDDMLVTMAAHEETGREMGNDAGVVERIVSTVSRARRGVIVASLTNFVAFSTGTSSRLPAIRDFVIYAAVGIVFLLIFQSTFYVACLTLDLRRQQKNKRDFGFCCVSQAGPTDGCFGRKFNIESPSISQRIIGIWLPKIILHPLGKVSVAAISLFLLIMGVLGAMQVQQDFDPEWLLPKGSWVNDVYSVRDKYFSSSAGKGAIPFAVYTKNEGSPPSDYFNHQDELHALSVNLQTNRYVSSAPPVDSWYISYIQWLNSSATYVGNITSEGRPLTSEVFYASLQDYLSSHGNRFKRNIIFLEPSKNIILSSKIQAFFVELNDSGQQVNAMNSVRKVAINSAPSMDAIAYTFPFLYYEGFAVIMWDTIKEVIIAGSSIFVILLLMLADLTTSVCVGVMVIVIDVELVGFMHWAGLTFNSVTSICLVIAIGIAVDYSAFTAFSFLTRIGTRNERSKKTLQHFGVPVFNGGFTLFLAILPAIAASSYIFRTIFKMFAMIVLLGLWHALCALPVLLSFVGSPPYKSAYKQENKIDAAGASNHSEPQLQITMQPPQQLTIDS